MTSNTAVQKYKNLKEHKKTQKEKALAKRAAAAAKQSKQQKATRIEFKTGPVVATDGIDDKIAQQKASIMTDIIPEKELLEDVVFAANVVNIEDENSTVPDTVLNHNSDPCCRNGLAVSQDGMFQDIMHEAIINDAAPPHNHSSSTSIDRKSSDLKHSLVAKYPLVNDVFDTHAERKALEAALYDNMESPKKMCARIRKIASASAEYHRPLFVLTDETEPHTFAAFPRAIDSNGFECVAFCNDAPANISLTRVLSIDQLFSMVSSSGVSVVGSLSSKNHQTLEMIEKQQHKAAVNLENAANMRENNNLFPSADGLASTLMLGGVEEAHTCPTQALSSTMANLTFGCYGESSQIEPFMDPAIISLKMKKQDSVLINDLEVRPIQPWNPALAMALQAGSEKLAAMLGIDSQVLVPEVSRQGLGNRSRNTSCSTDGYIGAQSPYWDSGFQTPLTHDTPSPPPTCKE